MEQDIKDAFKHLSKAMNSIRDAYWSTNTDGSVHLHSLLWGALLEISRSHTVLENIVEYEL